MDLHRMAAWTLIVVLVGLALVASVCAERVFRGRHYFGLPESLRSAFWYSIVTLACLYLAVLTYERCATC